MGGDNQKKTMKTKVNWYDEPENTLFFIGVKIKKKSENIKL